jgi:hypothetical protein
LLLFFKKAETFLAILGTRYGCSRPIFGRHRAGAKIL